MTETVINIWEYSLSGFQQFAQTASSSYRRIQVKAPTRDIILLGSFLALLQVLDGVMTWIGIYHFGTSAEGNFLLKWLMEAVGYTSALILVKSLAISVVALLCFLSDTVTWLRSALIAVILVYLGAAIIPWSIIIATRIL